MAYSDYGGFAYKNGVREESRSDVELSEIGLRSTPGQYPGFTTLNSIQKKESFHVILGSGPIYVGLYKQTNVAIRRGAENIENLYWDSKTGLLLSRKVDDVIIEVCFEYTDNYYLYVRVIEPDGTAWTGFSGYGVGAGLEDGSRGYNTDKCVRRLESIFPKTAEQPAAPQPNNME